MMKLLMYLVCITETVSLINASKRSCSHFIIMLRLDKAGFNVTVGDSTILC
jgi:hypothetical protein